MRATPITAFVYYNIFMYVVVVVIDCCHQLCFICTSLVYGKF